MEDRIWTCPFTGAKIAQSEGKLMKISTFFKPLSFIPALLLMYMIYSFSAEPGELSSTTSYKVSRGVVKVYSTVTGQDWDEWQVDEKATAINPYIRKGAHMTEYFLLAIAVSFPLYVYGVRGILLMLLAGLICVGYAFGDEYHQASVAGRVSSKRDVGIDSIGIFAGILLVRILGWSTRVAVTGPRMERRQRRQQEELDRREEELERREQRIRREQMRYRGVSDTDADPDTAYGKDRYSDSRYQGGRYQDTGEPDAGYPYDRFEDDEYQEERYREDGDQREYEDEEEADGDFSDELSEDIPIFSRRKHRRH